MKSNPRRIGAWWGPLVMLALGGLPVRGLVAQDSANAVRVVSVRVEVDGRRQDRSQVIATYRLQGPRPGAGLALRALELRGVRVLGLRAESATGGAELTLDREDAPLLRARVAPNLIRGLRGDTLEVTLLYRVEAEEGALSPLGTGAPLFALGAAPAEATPGMFQALLRLPEGHEVVEAFPSVWKMERGAGSPLMAIELPVLPGLLRVVSEPGPLAFGRGHWSEVAVLALTVGLVLLAWSHLRKEI